MNSPEGFLPKKQNFTMQAVQVLWFRPIDIMVLSVSIIGGIDDTLDIMSSAAVRGSYRQQL